MTTTRVVPSTFSSRRRTELEYFIMSAQARTFMSGYLRYCPSKSAGGGLATASSKSAAFPQNRFMSCLSSDRWPSNHRGDGHQQPTLIVGMNRTKTAMPVARRFSSVVFPPSINPPPPTHPRYPRLSTLCCTAPRSPRLFSSAPEIQEAEVPNSSESVNIRNRPIRILYASQGGTAQLFAQQLAEALEEYYSSQQGTNDNQEIPEITIEGMHQYPNKDPSLLLTPGEAVHIFMVSVTGVGEPPDKGRAFYEYLMNSTQENESSSPSLLSQLDYTVFGLGNSKAHPNHYNVIGINLDKRLEELGGRRIYPLGLGDDGDCLEDDFDTWMENFLALIRKESSVEEGEEEMESGGDDSPAEAPIDILPTTPVEDDRLTGACRPGVAKNPFANERRISAKYETLQLDPPMGDFVCHDLFHLKETDHPFYSPSTVQAKVTQNRSLSAYGGESGLREIRVDYSQQKSAYTSGDHCLVYPRNAGCIVEAYLAQLDVNPHSIIQGFVKDLAADGPQPYAHPYPYPTGLTVYETLSHCIDLGAIPSPSFSRFLLRSHELDYKQEIAIPRRTILDLLLSSSGRKHISLEDLLFQAVPMKPRYYSIASSSLASPNELCLTFRPVKYITAQGHLREGVCTNYMASMVTMEEGGEEDGTHMQYMPISVASNPTFRLPEDSQVPILMIAGGCGVAPIRAFVQERIFLAKRQQAAGGTSPSLLGEGLVYLGFRSPEDEVYRPLIDKALDLRALTDVKIAHSQGGRTGGGQYRGNVTALVRLESQRIWDHMESGGYTYLCGGARSFGAAVEKELIELIQKHGKMDFESAETYLKKLIETGRLLEDLAD